MSPLQKAAIRCWGCGARFDYAKGTFVLSGRYHLLAPPCCFKTHHKLSCILHDYTKPKCRDELLPTRFIDSQEAFRCGFPRETTGLFVSSIHKFRPQGVIAC